jgi:hypothetical protein
MEAQLSWISEAPITATDLGLKIASIAAKPLSISSPFYFWLYDTGRIQAGSNFHSLPPLYTLNQSLMMFKHSNEFLYYCLESILKIYSF